MTAHGIRKILVAASMFASFIIYLCVSVAEIMPFLFITAICFAALTRDKLISCDFTAVKLFTQKAE